MMIVLPGSVPAEPDESAGGSGGRFTADELGALSEVAAWWRNRQAAGDSAEPLETHFGGVDLAGTARTVGLTPATVAFGRPLLPMSSATTGGAALLAGLALGAVAYFLFFCMDCMSRKFMVLPSGMTMSPGFWPALQGPSHLACTMAVPLARPASGGS